MEDSAPALVVGVVVLAKVVVDLVERLDQMNAFDQLGKFQLSRELVWSNHTLRPCFLCHRDRFCLLI